MIIRRSGDVNGAAAFLSRAPRGKMICQAEYLCYNKEGMKTAGRSEMHLFLTGEKRIGKSTLVQKLLEGHETPAGFYTRKSEAAGCLGVHLLRAATGEAPCEANRLFACGGKRKPDMTQRFERLGCAALEDCAGAKQIVMDEIGPHEAEAEAFQRAVLRVLDGETPVLGVLQKAPSEFLNAIKRHPKVRVVTVTEANREGLAARVAPLIGFSHGGEPDSYGAIVLEEGHVLMIRNGSKWSFPKGRREAGESEEETAVRETREETGIDAALEPGAFATVKSARPGDERLVTFYRARSVNGLQEPSCGFEIPEAQWVPIEEAAARLTFPQDRQALEAILRQA